MLTAALAVLCALLVLVLLVQRPAIWPVLVVLAVLWFALFGVFRYRVRSWVARWVCGGSFEKSKTQFSLEPLSQPAALLSGETVLWYNTEFRTRLMKGEALLVPRVQKVLPGLDLQEARKVSGQLLNLADGVWSAHSSTVPGEAESMTLLVLNEETALRKVEAEYKASRPGYLVFLVDGYDDVFSDMLDSERARLLEGINRVLEDMIGRGTGFLRRVASGRYIAVVEERQLEQFAKRGYDVLDKIRALDPSVNLSISIGVGRGAKTLREAQDMAVQALDMAQGRGGDQAAEMTPDGFTFYGGVSHGVEKRSKVRSRIVADQLVKLIKEADHVVIMGHRMSDLDAIGSAEGVLRICKICDVPAVIAVRRDATLAGSLINALIAAGQEDDFIDPKGALPIISQRTLCIVVDTYQLGLVESREILEKCGKVAVIDHHRKGVGFIEKADLVCHEPYASSAILKKGRARLHQTHADGLCRGVAGAGNDRRSRGKAGLCRSLRCDRAHDVCGPCTRRDLVRAAVQPALCLVYTAVRLVQRSERAFRKGLIDDIFPGQARRQKGAAREEIGRLCVDLRLMPPQPEDLCGRVAGADGMAEQLLHPRLSVMLCQPRRFL